jgi:MoaA/NifB/PqqE/SkfB family radical SAM enzyme
MKRDVLNKVIEDANSGHPAISIREIQCGENGDAFLNPNAVEFLRMIRRGLPNANVGMFTNFDNLTRDISEVILKEDLLDQISVNIDGSTPENYCRVKHLNYENVAGNIMAFLELRKRYSKGLPLTIWSIPYSKYVESILNNFGFAPANLKSERVVKLKNDFKAIKTKWLPLLNSDTDTMKQMVTVCGWAERDVLPRDPRLEHKLRCPKLELVRDCAFIAPDGSWYLCCYDYDCDYVIGNVLKEHLGQLAVSERRLNTIRRLENRQYSAIGPPCESILSCQPLFRSEVATRLYQRVISIDAVYEVIKRFMH